MARVHELQPMRCPHCQSDKTVKNGTVKRQEQSRQQRYLCGACAKRFNERTHTPMARLRTTAMMVSAAINVRTEGLGVRATGRSFGKSHSTIIRWERRLASQGSQWSPPAPDGAEVTLEGDEVYTRVGENLPPPLSLKVGLSTSLSGRVATGSMLGQGKKRRNCLSKGHQRLGSGRKEPTLSGGLPMENGAMALLYGNLPVSDSKPVSLTQTTDDGKFGVKGWRWR